MRFRKIRPHCLFLILLVTVSLTSCAKIHHLPIAQQVDSQKITEFNSKKTLKIINNQPSKERLILAKFYLGSFYASLFEFSDVAVDSLKSELVQRGMTISDDPEKVLKLSVSHAQLTEVAFRWRCDVTLDMETAEGYNASFKVNNLTPSNTRVCGGAITLAITELLNDPKVISYLQE